MRRHVVDGPWLIEQTINFDHYPLFDCPRGSVSIIDERRKGLLTEWHLRCNFCNKSSSLSSEKKDAPLSSNQAAVNAAVYAGRDIFLLIPCAWNLEIVFLSRH